jgi:hypothetical protein
MTDARHDLIFVHSGNARAAASVILIGVVAALIGSVFMAIGPRMKQDPHPERDTSTGTAAVRVVGQASPQSGPCEQQVWPNIDQRCLVRVDAPANSANAASPARNDKLSPLTATTAPATPANTTTPNMDAATPEQGGGPGGAQGVTREATRDTNRRDVINNDSTWYGSPAAPQRDAFNSDGPSDIMTDPDYGNPYEWRSQEYYEAPRRRSHRHYRQFHFHFGAFRF